MRLKSSHTLKAWTLNNAGIAAMWRGGCIIKVGDTDLTDLSHLIILLECLPVRHYCRLPREPQAREPPHQPILPEGYLASPTRMEACHRTVHVGQGTCGNCPTYLGFLQPMGYSYSGLHDRSLLFRWLPYRDPAGQPHPGTA